MSDVDTQEYRLKSIVEKVQVSEVRDSLRQQLSELQCKFERLKSRGETVTQQLTLLIADRQALHDSLCNAKLWIDRKELELRTGKTLPLTSVDAKKKLEDSKVEQVFGIICCLYQKYSMLSDVHYFCRYIICLSRFIACLFYKVIRLCLLCYYCILNYLTCTFK